MSTPAPRRPERWSALPRIMAKMPPVVWLIVGLVVVLLGLLIVIRPLTSLWLLAAYVGISAIISGVLDLLSPRVRAVQTTPRWWTRTLAVIWIIAGIAILVWFGRSLDLLPDAISVLLLLGGVSSLVGVGRGRVSQRVLSGAWGLAQIAFGVLALGWPDVTVLVVAVFFGVRTVFYGIALLARGVRQITAGEQPLSADPRAQRRRQAWAATGRYATAVLVLVVAVASWGLDDFLEDGAPVVDAFYETPDEVPTGPGHLIRSDAYDGRAPAGGVVTRILYTTTDSRGLAAVASALVVAPVDMPLGSRPVIAWNHGTTGVARACAPSLTDAAATKWAIPAVEEALAEGWVVVATDYSGQGAEGNFPYLIGEGEARSTLDAVRAARELEDLRLRADVVLWGHSQGGHAALWAAQIAGEYAPDLRIRGTAAISPVGDPLALAEELKSGGETPEASALLSVLVSWVLVPYADAYYDVRVEDYVAPGARWIVREMTQRCPTEPGVIVSVIAALGTAADRPLYDTDLTTGALGRRLEQNAVTGPFDVPVFVAWGSDDEVIPASLHAELVSDLCEAGEDLRFLEYVGMDHTGVMLPGSRFLPRLIDWTEGRFVVKNDTINECARLAAPVAG